MEPVRIRGGGGGAVQPELAGPIVSEYCSG